MKFQELKGFHDTRMAAVAAWGAEQADERGSFNFRDFEVILDFFKCNPWNGVVFLLYWVYGPVVYGLTPFNPRLTK